MLIVVFFVVAAAGVVVATAPAGVLDIWQRIVLWHQKRKGNGKHSWKILGTNMAIQVATPFVD